MSEEIIISVESLVQKFNKNFAVLENISFKIKKGDFVALIGQNGAGKTTLVKHFNGLLKPEGGKIYINDRDTKGLTTAELSKTVGYVFQNPDHQIFMERVDKEVAFGPGNLNLEEKEVARRTEKALRDVGLEAYASQSPLSLSKGQRQRVALASILAMEPEIIILDEPTTGQDYRETIEIMDLIRALNEKGHTIIFITHDMQLVAKYAKRVILMGKGQVLADGTPKQVLSQTPVLARTFLKPPQITLLAQELAEHDLPQDAICVEELLVHLKTKINSEGQLAG